MAVKLGKVLATSGTLPGITKLIKEFYCDEPFELKPCGLKGVYEIYRGDRKLSTVVVKYGRRFGFGIL